MQVCPSSYLKLICFHTSILKNVKLPELWLSRVHMAKCNQLRDVISNNEIRSSRELTQMKERSFNYCVQQGILIFQSSVMTQCQLPAKSGLELSITLVGLSKYQRFEATQLYLFSLKDLIHSISNQQASSSEDLMHFTYEDMRQTWVLTHRCTSLIFLRRLRPWDPRNIQNSVDWSFLDCWDGH